MGGKKKGRVSGLGSLGRSMKTITPGTSLTTTISGDIEEKIRNEVHSFNTSLQAQLEQERQEKEEMKKELYETRNTLNILMKKLGYEASSSHSKPISHNQNNSSDEDDSSEEEDSSDEEDEDSTSSEYSNA